jgi:hypothetical protein
MKTRGIFGMLDELAAKAVGLQVVARAEGVNDPHLVAQGEGTPLGDQEPISNRSNPHPRAFDTRCIGRNLVLVGARI